MQALLEYSQKNYGPLPSELRPYRVRSRTSSRATPYPLPNVRHSMSPEQFLPHPPPEDVQRHQPPADKSHLSQGPAVQNVLREVSTNVSVKKSSSPPPSLGSIKPFTPFSVPDVNLSNLPNLPTLQEKKNEIGLPVPTRPRVTSSARRTALGWSKRSTGAGTGKSSSSDYKENNGSMVIT